MVKSKNGIIPMRKAENHLTILTNSWIGTIRLVITKVSMKSTIYRLQKMLFGQGCLYSASWTSSFWEWSGILMQQNRFKRNGEVYKCQTFGTLHWSLLDHLRKSILPGAKRDCQGRHCHNTGRVSCRNHNGWAAQGGPISERISAFQVALKSRETVLARPRARVSYCLDHSL